MKSLSVVAGATLVAASLSVAVATAAPASPMTAADLINEVSLQSFDACTIAQVRRFQRYTHRTFPGANHAVRQVTAMAVDVDVSC